MRYKADSKYKFSSIRTMTPRRDAELASTVWAEGRESLKELLKYCIENRICTLACCAGHDEVWEDFVTGEKNEGYSWGYIAFTLRNKRTSDAMLPLFSEMITELGVDRIEFFTYKDNGTIDATMSIREGMEDYVFGRILHNLKRIRGNEEIELDPMIKSMYDTITGIDRRKVEEFSVGYRLYLERGGAFGFKDSRMEKFEEREYLLPEEIIQSMQEIQQDKEIFKGNKTSRLDNIYQFCIDQKTVMYNRLLDIKWALENVSSKEMNEDKIQELE